MKRFFSWGSDLQGEVCSSAAVVAASSDWSPLQELIAGVGCSWRRRKPWRDLSTPQHPSLHTTPRDVAQIQAMRGRWEITLTFLFQPSDHLLLLFFIKSPQSAQGRVQWVQSNFMSSGDSCCPKGAEEICS